MPLTYWKKVAEVAALCKRDNIDPFDIAAWNKEP